MVSYIPSSLSKYSQLTNRSPVEGSNQEYFRGGREGSVSKILITYE